MLIPPEVWRAVLDAGVDMLASDERHVELRRGADRVRLAVHQSAYPLSPSDAAALADRSGELRLLVLPSATDATASAAERAGWSWLVTDDRGVRGVLQLGEARLEVGAVGSASASQPGTKPGRIPWGTFTIARLLLNRGPSSQKALASSAGVSQPRVSQVLARFGAAGLVRRLPAGWAVTDVDALVDWWLANYPGPGGIATYWYGLDPLRRQATAVLQRGVDAAADETAAPVVSGDVAADLLAPWRTPQRAVVYARTGFDLAEAGLTPAGVEEATLEFIVPADVGVWLARPTRRGSPLPLADPLQILWDVHRSPGPDADEAATRLRSMLWRDGCPSEMARPA